MLQRFSSFRRLGLVAVAGALATMQFGCKPKEQGGDYHADGQSQNQNTMTESPRGSSTASALMSFDMCSTGMPTQGNWKCDPVLVDLNRDGYLDLAAIPRLGDGPRVWLGGAGAMWTESSHGLSPGSKSCGGGIAVGDVNRDGNLDLAIADHCQGVFVYLGDGSGNWQMVTQGLYPSNLMPPGGELTEWVGAEDIDIGDVNEDGFLDLVAGASDDGGIALYYGNGTGADWKLQTTSELPSRGWTNRVLFADMNLDKHLDLVAAYDTGPVVWMGDGKGQWRRSSDGMPEPSYRGLYRGIAVGDIDEDGLPDIAAANWVDGPEVYIQQVNGSWKQTDDAFPRLHGGAVGLALGDLDRDGHLDMVVSGRMNWSVGHVYGVFALHGDGKGRWDYVENSKIPATGLSFTWGIALGDVDGDRFPDIAAGSGGIVASQSDDPGEPVVPERMLIWCTKPSKSN